MKRKIQFTFLLLISCFVVFIMVGCKKHKHSYSDYWAYNSDEHYKLCDCGEKKDNASHDLVWTTPIQPNYESTGKKVGECSVCEYKEEETLPKLNHSYSSNWTFDDTHHYHLCTDTGYLELTDTKVEHTFDVETIITVPSYENDGSKKLECSICSFEKIVTIPALDKKIPVISTKPTASAIYYGQKLSDSVLSGGVADCAGTFTWKISDGIPTKAGSIEDIVVFTPTDLVEYQIVEFSITHVVVQLYVDIEIEGFGVVAGADENVMESRTPIKYGDSLKLLVVPDFDCGISEIKVNGVDKLLSNEYYLEDITSPIIFYAKFVYADESYTITVESNGDFGTLSNDMPFGGEVFDYYDPCVFTITALPGYTIKKLTIGSCEIKDAADLQEYEINIRHVVASVDIYIEFEKHPQLHVFFVDNEGDVVASNGTVKIDGIDANGYICFLDNLSFRVAANTGYYIKKVYTNEDENTIYFQHEPGSLILSRTFQLNDITEDINIYVVIEKYHTVTITTDGNGVASTTADGSNPITTARRFDNNGYFSFFVVANTGYYVLSYTINGATETVYPDYTETVTPITLTNITEDMEITVRFVAIP